MVDKVICAAARWCRCRMVDKVIVRRGEMV
jgi:hypothetical protein